MNDGRPYVAGAVELELSIEALAGLPARPLKALGDRGVLVVREGPANALVALVSTRSLRHAQLTRFLNTEV